MPPAAAGDLDSSSTTQLFDAGKSPDKKPGLNMPGVQYARYASATDGCYSTARRFAVV
jgi:hypothetical protein